MEEWLEKAKQMISITKLSEIMESPGTPEVIAVHPKELLKAALIYEIYQDKYAKEYKDHVFRPTFQEKLIRILNELRQSLGDEVMSNEGWLRAQKKYEQLRNEQTANEKFINPTNANVCRHCGGLLHPDAEQCPFCLMPVGE